MTGTAHLPTHLHGKNLIGFARSADGQKKFHAYNPREGRELDPAFYEATAEEVNRALDLAAQAAIEMRMLEAARIAEFLANIGEELLAAGDALIEAADRETALGIDRLRGERDRTVNQLKLFAGLASEGSWVDARIDPPLPDRKPLPRPDIRRMLQPIGPVAVFGASNFPLAFSVAGGDTASAFAARNPVIVKAHPAHPATSEIAGEAIRRAAQATRMPEGTFSLLHSLGTETSIALATNPAIRAIAFTGSLRAGRALFDAAARRPDPIPVFAEMGSVNPVVLLPGVLENGTHNIAEGLYRSVLLGVGQFCTSPGLVFGLASGNLDKFTDRLSTLFSEGSPGTMLNPAICRSFAEKFKAASALGGVSVKVSARQPDAKRTEGQPGLLLADAPTWLKSEELHEEIFGPSTLVVRCSNSSELAKCAEQLEGSLTATIHGTPEELARNRELIEILSRKAGRLIFNGFPTGVEVGYAMHHGGPYPATTDEKFTSVGAAAIYRFARPVCYQNFPEQLLPPELQDANPRRIWRMVNGQLTRDSL
ncbi:MAG: aldehyde dehydrogenase (NADP(+)) [Acidobacteriaceae bacterium]|nr:aldehyde dehydrogenase (NADP(+)) [Acidobacteriaceae bacterium]MBV8572072.1 aldehyde dehydrogenase (NADP(+)) [Acidobacteriaceae bacterium]